MVQEKHRQAKEKLGELRDAGDDAWEDMKDGISTAWNAVATPEDGRQGFDRNCKLRSSARIPGIAGHR